MASQQAQIALTIAGLKSKLSHEARDGMYIHSDVTLAVNDLY